MRNLKILSMIALVLFCLTQAVCLGEAGGDVPLVVLDCDMGAWNDDALALSLLLKAEEAGQLRILGITLEGGNNFVGADYENYGETQASAQRCAEEFLAAVGREDIPVYPGTDFPTGYGAEDVSELADFYANLRYLRFNDGYGAVHFYEDLSGGELADRNDARDFLLSCAREQPGRVTVLAIGPVMNLARAAEADPAFAENVAVVYYMAGAFGAPVEDAYADGEPVSAVGGANITPFAEYNACFDPRALEICLTAGFPAQVFLPGEVNAPVDETVISRLEAADAAQDPIAEAWLDRYRDALPDYPYWDPVTAAAFLRPEGLRGDERYVTVCDDRNDPRCAMTTAITAEEYAALPEAERQRYGKAFVATAYEGFWEFAVELLCR